MARGAAKFSSLRSVATEQPWLERRLQLLVRNATGLERDYTDARPSANALSVEHAGGALGLLRALAGTAVRRRKRRA